MLWGMLLGGFATTAATIDHAVLAILGLSRTAALATGRRRGVRTDPQQFGPILSVTGPSWTPILPS